MFDESLLILSDVHLGNDLNDVAPGGARRSASVDVDLVSLLRHYRAAPRGGRRWRLVIAGDFIDFIGMAILPHKGDLSTATSDEERAHGLGNTSDNARASLAPSTGTNTSRSPWLRPGGRPTRGATQYARQHAFPSCYVVGSSRPGAGCVIRFLARFLGAVAEMLRLRRAYVSKAAHVVR